MRQNKCTHSKNEPFTILTRPISKNPSFTCEERSLLLIVFAEHPDKEITIEFLKKHLHIGKKKLYSTFRKLEAKGYLVKEKRRNSKTGRFERVSLIFFENPKEAAKLKESLPRAPVLNKKVPRAPLTPWLITTKSKWQATEKQEDRSKLKESLPRAPLTPWGLDSNELSAKEINPEVALPLNNKKINTIKEGLSSPQSISLKTIKSPPKVPPQEEIWNVQEAVKYLGYWNKRLNPEQNFYDFEHWERILQDALKKENIEIVDLRMGLEWVFESPHGDATFWRNRFCHPTAVIKHWNSMLRQRREAIDVVELEQSNALRAKRLAEQNRLYCLDKKVFDIELKPGLEIRDDVTAMHVKHLDRQQRIGYSEKGFIEGLHKFIRNNKRRTQNENTSSHARGSKTKNQAPNGH